MCAAQVDASVALSYTGPLLTAKMAQNGGTVTGPGLRPVRFPSQLSSNATQPLYDVDYADAPVTRTSTTRTDQGEERVKSLGDLLTAGCRPYHTVCVVVVIVVDGMDFTWG